MRAPDFWRRPGLLPTLLSPVAAAYDLIGRQRRAGVAGLSLPIPVICVGNLVLGGAGKTPVALALAETLMQRGLKPNFLTRGYGGSLAGPLLVDPKRHSAQDVGDEPLLLAGRAPTLVSRDRPAGARMALEQGAEVLIMDDGFQNPSLQKDCSFLVVDAAYGFGNGKVFPAGPLREGLADGLTRADAMVLLRGGEPAIAPMLAEGLPCLGARLEPQHDLPEGRYFAFAGIGRPEKFFASLKLVGVDLAGSLAFPDHHRYAAEDLARLRREAEAARAQLITTEKDLVRLALEEREGIAVFPVSLVWDDPAALAELLDPVLAARADG